VTSGLRKSEYRGGIPTTPILLLRFPDGDVEYRTTRGELPVGALVRARGATWRVRCYVADSAILDAAESPSDGAAGGAIVVPDLLGDKPPTLEILRA
jgi:hypothetical protein